MVQSSTLIDSECKKKHINIANLKMWVCVAAKIVNPVKVGTERNLSDVLTNGTAWKTHHFLTGIFFGWWKVGDRVKMTAVKP